MSTRARRVADPSVSSGPANGKVEVDASAPREQRLGSVFGRIWAATSVSAMGTAVTDVALPLTAIYVLHASAFEVGVVSAATVVAWLVIGLPAGVLVHRVPLRRGLLAADLVRAAVLASVPVAAWCGVLTLAQLVAVAIVIGLCSVLFDVGFSTYLPAVVSKQELTSRNSLIQGGESVAQVGGPAVAGVLVQLVGAVTTIVLDVASYLFSAACLFGLPAVAERGGSVVGGVGTQIKEGLSFVRRDRLIGPMTLAATALNFTGAALGAMSSVFLVRTLHLSAGWVGLLIASAGLGGFLGASVATPVVHRLGSARAAVVSIVVAPLFALLIGTATRGVGVSLFVVGNVGLAAATVVFSVVARTYRQVHVPPELLARVMATVRFVSWGALPIGGLVAGGLAEWLGVRAALEISAAVLLLGPIPILLSPARGRRDLPDPSAQHATDIGETISEA